jgi:serine protease Do
VVSIDTKRTVSSGRSFQFDEPFGRLFRDLIPDFQEREYEVPSYASGFVFRSDGYIVTNNHVVADADEIVVRFSDESEYSAEVVGRDPNTDIAILRIDNGDLPAVRLGDSDAIRVGDWAIAIGNPFGRLEGSLTVGVISAKGRSALSIMGGSPALQDFIQTDASINFGNSGGPLVNIRGEAVGMNSAINPLGQGIGFAIPINLIKRVADEIIEHGKVAWGFLGILPQEIDKDLADALGVEPKSGILVGSVVEDSPAEDAGMRRRDIIVELDSEPVSGDVDEFRLRVAQMGTGREVEVEVLRDGKRKQLKVELGERPTDLAEARERREREDWLGLRVDHVTGAQGSRQAPSDVESGVVVVGVEEGSPAWEEGIRAGDLIEEIDGQEVDDLEDYEKLVEEAKEKGDKPVLFLVRRDDINRYVAIKPSKE